MKNLQSEDSPTGFLEKWQFVRRTPILFTAWGLFALATALIGWGSLFAHLNEEQSRVEKLALLEAQALARSHADRLMRTINAVDQVARHVRSDWRYSRQSSRLERMAQEGVSPDYSRYYVTLVDRQGMPFASTHPNPAFTFLGDRPYFRIQQDAKADRLYVGDPLLSRISGMNVVNLSRKLVDADGAFDGIVLISVAIDSFTVNYDTTVLGKYGLLGVVSEDRSWGVARVGHKVFPPEQSTFVTALGTHFDSNSGSAKFNGSRWFKDNRGRFLGWHPIDGHPLIALVGLDENEKLAQFWIGRESSIQYALWATAALAVLTLVAIALTVELAWKNHRLNLSHATYRLATEEASEGFYILKPLRDATGRVIDFLVLDCNQQGAEFLHRRREQLIGKAVSLLYGDTDMRKFVGHLSQALEHGVYEDEIEVAPTSPLKVHYIHVKIIRSGGNLAVRLRDISEAKAHVAELKRRGDEDILTNLPNRQWVHSYLPGAIDRARQASQSLALLFIDLDGFKKVNDTAGHAAGDEVLQHAAQRLSVAIRPHDKVVRFGGDEFVVVLEKVEHRIDAAHVAERVQHAFEQPFQVSQGVYVVGTSIGIALFPEDGEDTAALLEKADIAMYAVKTNGKRGYQFYEAKFYHALRERLDNETALRDAIARNEFVMYYQPRVDVITGAMVSLEALIRWQHPSKGLLEPINFIQLAEETGLIIEIGELVIDKVCAQLACWANQQAQIIPVSVNISPRQINSADVVGTLSAALARHSIPAHLIELEITESSMMAESSEILKTLSILQSDGIKILVDDFGTGYSSLSQLHRLNFDVLKVDQTFTAELENSEEGRVFFTAIVTMAHALHMRVVAEGVETHGQIAILRELQCDEIQGFYLSRPLPAGEQQPTLPKWLFQAA